MTKSDNAFIFKDIMDKGLKQRIIDATIEIGASEGMEFISNSRIASRCGVSTTSIYYYFKDKNDLVYSALSFVSHEVTAHNPKNSHDPLEEQYRQILFDTVEYFKEHPARSVFYTRALVSGNYNSARFTEFLQNCPLYYVWEKGVQEKKFMQGLGNKFATICFFPICLFLYMHIIQKSFPTKKEIKSFIDAMCEAVKYRD